jgi:microcystin-dependent protein
MKLFTCTKTPLIFSALLVSTASAQQPAVANATPAAAPAVTSTAVTTTGGTTNYLPKFTGTATLGNSIIYDNGTDVGIGIVPNGNAKLDVNGPMIMRGNMTVSRTGNATAAKGYPSWGFDFYSNVYRSSDKVTYNPFFQLQSEPTGNNTASIGSTLNVLYSVGGGTPAETGFYINPNGTLHFASAQTFPITTGATGPQGPTGPAGPQGPIGPAGPTGTVPANLTALSGQLSTTNGVAYLGSDRFSYPGSCVIGDTVLSVNGYGGGNALPADGRLLPIPPYTAIFTLIGINFGGNGTSNFALPDLRAFAPKGLQYSICVYGTFPSAE